MKAWKVWVWVALASCGGEDDTEESGGGEDTGEESDASDSVDTSDTSTDTSEEPFDGRPGEGRWLVQVTEEVSNALNLSTVLPGFTVEHGGDGIILRVDRFVSGVQNPIVVEPATYTCEYRPPDATDPENTDLWLCGGPFSLLQAFVGIRAADADHAEFMVAMQHADTNLSSQFRGSGERFRGLSSSCGSDAITPPSTAGEKIELPLQARVQAEQSTYGLANAAAGGFTLTDPYGNPVQGQGSVPDLWPGQVPLGGIAWHRGVHAAVPGALPSTLVTASSNLNGQAELRVVRGPLFDQFLVGGGLAPTQAGRGLLEVHAVTASGLILSDADVSISAGFEDAFVLGNDRNHHFAERSSPAQTRGGSLFASNVCPGMATVSVSNQGQACALGPSGAQTSVAVPIRAGEHTLVRFVCP